MRYAVLMCLTAALVSCSTAHDHETSGEWEELFDGKTLTGWVQRGGQAKYTVQDGCIVGTTVPNTPNSFLCTERTFSNFIFECDFKVHPKMNSGIQIRSESYPEYRKGQVHGYQVEIDPSARKWTAGIYDEGRRGWLNDLKDNPAAQNAFKQNEWNHVRVECIGDHIRTWLNGVPAADLRDSLTLEGFIGLQVHGIGKREETLDVRWKNLRIKELGYATWKPMFTDHSFDGWHIIPGGKWAIADGLITGTSHASEKHHGILLSNTKHDDFTVEFKFKCAAGNSGFYFRSEPVDSLVSLHGMQAEITPFSETGGLYETGGRGWVVKTDDATLKKAGLKQGDWNTMTVYAHGGDLKVQVNGITTAEVKNDPGAKTGYMGFQLHGGMDMHVEFKDVQMLNPQ
jgi:hypothetical protein